MYIVWILFLVQEAKELSKSKIMHTECSTLQTTSTIHVLDIHVTCGCCFLLFVIRGSFVYEFSQLEYEACPLSGIKKVRLWDVVSVYLDIDFNPCHS